MNKNIKKKKKGFTLIELVIVLAVLAIIAMIAIPNFTRVRNKALIDGDKRSAEQIEKITLMALANGDIPTKEVNYQIVKNDGKVKVTPVAPPPTRPVSPSELEKVKTPPALVPEANIAKYEDLLRDIENPQIPATGKGGYTVVVKADGSVGVGYTTKPTFTFNGKEVKQGLAGTLADDTDLIPNK